MRNGKKDVQDDGLIGFLQEREKELNCLYRIESILNRPEATLGDVCKGVIESLPLGWQYPDVCKVMIRIEKTTFTSPDFIKTPWELSADIKIRDKVAGKVSVFYTEEMPSADIGPFLEGEARLLETIANRLSHFVIFNIMKQVFEEFESSRQDNSDTRTPEWRVVLNLLRQTDRNLFLNISRRMLNHLCWSGIEEADQLLRSSTASQFNGDEEMAMSEDNVPHPIGMINFSNKLSDQTFEIADKYLKDEQILSYIRKWILEDKISFLVQAVHQNLPLAEVTDAIRRYRRIAPEGIELPANTERGLRVSLIRQVLSDDISFINIAKNFIEIGDYEELLDHIICSPEGSGKLGGKGAGLFLAEQIIKKSKEFSKQFDSIKVPKTWYITTNVLMEFVKYNNLNEVVEQKYKDINQVRLEYPHVIQTFKNSNFPPEIIQGLSLALDDFGDKPLIIRSSSLLEDRSGAVFSGKYKSIFLANQGSKQERLMALMDAIAEVYASVFGPDPIEYRAERGLLDFAEEMGILIQEVVGNRVGDYFFPTFAGVAFSRNEFRWSPRIKREDGLIRLVLGLGTRAVDRIGDDYPILIAPGQPGLRVNVTIEDVLRYAPKRMDIINLWSKTFETKDIGNVFKFEGDKIPNIEQMVSVYEDQMLHKPFGKHVDFDRDDVLVTFEGLVTNTRFVDKMKFMLDLLEKELGRPVDIEFASDGSNFYLLQCRPQSYSTGSEPAAIPADIPKEKLLFSANRYVSNGRVPDITHIVYIDPEKYESLSEHTSLTAVGRAVGKLNMVLPKRKFILIGPGRWGSRGDIKLGVRVTYSDINNTAVLIEMARKKGNYLPDLSFGTHFFQDLVETDIRYLPLYPDDEGVVFNEEFFDKAKNILPEILPENATLADTIKLIDVRGETNGQVLRILMNAEQDAAVGMLDDPTADVVKAKSAQIQAKQQTENHWAWRMRMAENMASMLDPKRFGVEGVYIFGSTKNATAGPKSDIDLIIHFRGTEKQRSDLMNWLEGWSLCLDEMNFLRTRERTGKMLDVQLITDEDINRRSSYAAKIGAAVDAAKPLSMKTLN